MAVTVKPHERGSVYSIILYSHIVCIVPNYELNHAHTANFFMSFILSLNQRKNEWHNFKGQITADISFVGHELLLQVSFL